MALLPSRFLPGAPTPSLVLGGVLAWLTNTAFSALLGAVVVADVTAVTKARAPR